MGDKIEMLPSVDNEVKDMLITVDKSFRKKYNLEPDFYVRVPGRVNLIGEHIDYCGYSVCPMAIKQCIVAAVKSRSDSSLILSNHESGKYPDYSGKIGYLDVNKDTTTGFGPRWHDYVLCGLKGVVESGNVAPTKGLIIHLYGNIPVASGLSSSSALVCCAALSLSVTLNLSPTKKNLAEKCAKAERYIGTEGGGMDQAIIFNARRGTASLISFDPLRLTEVQIPPACTFVIAQSMVQKNKAASNDFNSRVVECRLASLIIGKHYLKNWKKFPRLMDLQKELKFDLGKMLKVVQEVFHDGLYTKLEVCQILDISEEELENKFLTRNTRHLNTFKLKPRVTHVFAEALRVDMFCSICDGAKSIDELGRLMNESHFSLKNLYECSHVELEKLVTICSLNGASGVRLTGAGWGGCVVALVPLATAEEFVKSVKAAFYTGKVPASVNIDDLIFITKPHHGAAVFQSGAVDY
ncbi:N-acetylgalactosamine kinase-like isoform X1 [Planococcus citri]|uniref:N-acetylgalactosamine kinase-like isoform X1 n=1 Tax=Planococcus citri TaxID=170843 RepID=UPI0031F85EFA